MHLYLGLLCLFLTAGTLSEAQNPGLKSCRRACHKTLIPVCSNGGKTFRNLCLLQCSGQVKQCNGPCPCRSANPKPNPTPAPEPQAVEVEYEGPATPVPQPVNPRPPTKPNPQPFYPAQPAQPNPQPFYPRQAVQPNPQPFYPPQQPQPNPQPFYQPRQVPVRTTTTPAPPPPPTQPPTQPPFYYDPFAFMFEPLEPTFVPLPQPVYVPTPRPDLKDMSCYCGNEKDHVCTVDGEEYDNSCKATCDGKIIACESKCPCYRYK